jgi:hypothetical protein
VQWGTKWEWEVSTCTRQEREIEDKKTKRERERERERKGERERGRERRKKDRRTRPKSVRAYRRRALVGFDVHELTGVTLVATACGAVKSTGCLAFAYRTAGSGLDGGLDRLRRGRTPSTTVPVISVTVACVWRVRVCGGVLWGGTKWNSFDHGDWCEYLRRGHGKWHCLLGQLTVL